MCVPKKVTMTSLIDASLLLLCVILALISQAHTVVRSAQRGQSPTTTFGEQPIAPPANVTACVKCTEANNDTAVDTEWCGRTGQCFKSSAACAAQCGGRCFRSRAACLARTMCEACVRLSNHSQWGLCDNACWSGSGVASCSYECSSECVASVAGCMNA